MADPKMKFLVVDDFSTMRRIVRNLLKELGYANVDEAEDGVMALAKLRAETFDFVVSDWNMPNMDGLTMLQNIRADPALEDVRILCISGMIEEDKIQELKLAGADDFLHKPFDIEELIDRMCGLLEIEPVPTSA